MKKWSVPWKFGDLKSKPAGNLRKNGKGIISNLLNRIIVMMDEEMIFTECARYIVLRKLIEKFESDRKMVNFLLRCAIYWLIVR